TTSSITVSPTTKTTYTVTGTLGGCTATATRAIAVGTPFTITPVTATPSTICAGGSTTLDAVMSSTTLTYCQPTYSSGTGSADYVGWIQIVGATLNYVTTDEPSPYYTLDTTSRNTMATSPAGDTYLGTLGYGTYSGQGMAA